MFFRSGGKLLESDWVQFHPTAFYDGNEKKQKFLISEAVRGDGAVLRNHKGEAFMKTRHIMKDLAPRNFVTEEIIKEMNKEERAYVYLDSTMFKKDYFKNRFPTIYSHCIESGIDPSKEYIPVAPCAHYVMGGIPVSLKGKTILDRVYACGECSRTGAHGNNRLASNSLLEALVFSKDVAYDINKRFSVEERKSQLFDHRPVIFEKDIFKYGNLEHIKALVEKINYGFLKNLRKK